MPYIDHRCATCGHTGLRHLASNFTACDAGCTGPCTLAPESVLVATFDTRGRRTTTIATPGEYAPSMQIRVCGCPNCHALYQELTGLAARRAHRQQATAAIPRQRRHLHLVRNTG